MSVTAPAGKGIVPPRGSASAGPSGAASPDRVPRSHDFKLDLIIQMDFQKSIGLNTLLMMPLSQQSVVQLELGH